MDIEKGDYKEWISVKIKKLFCYGSNLGFVVNGCSFFLAVA